jgi:8-oxo-dGTP diphosphatase
VEKRRRIGAYGVARDDSGKVLLVSASNTAWHLPGGGIDHAEDPRATVVREFREETGLDVEVTGLHSVSADLVEFPHLGVLQHHDRLVFDVRVLGGVLTAEAGERAGWVDPDHAELIPLAARVLLGRDLGNEINLRTRPFVDDEPANRVRRFGAYGLITDPGGRILLSQIAPNYPGAGRWHLPGGGTDFGEQPAEGLVREVFEESGQRVEVGDLVEVTFFHNPTALGPEGVPLDWFSVHCAAGHGGRRRLDGRSAVVRPGRGRDGDGDRSDPPCAGPYVILTAEGRAGLRYHRFSESHEGDYAECTSSA